MLPKLNPIIHVTNVTQMHIHVKSISTLPYPSIPARATCVTGLAIALHLTLKHLMCVEPMLHMC